MTLPKDPFMLLSLVNTALRDEYPSLDELCASEDIDKQSLEQSLKVAGFTYVAELNQFR